MEDFIIALEAHLHTLLLAEGDAEYASTAIRIVDARSHIFQTLSQGVTDEEHGIYALRDLCRLDDLSLQHIPDRGRLRSVARDFFGQI